MAFTYKDMFRFYLKKKNLKKEEKEPLSMGGESFFLLRAI